MFWKFGGYASASPIDSILDRPQFTLEDLLDENDLLGDLKARNGKLLDYLQRGDVVARLLDFVVAPKPEPTAEPVTEETEAESATSDDSGQERGRSRGMAFGRTRALSSMTESGRDEEEAETRRNRYAYVSCEILSCDNWAICETITDPTNRDLLHKFWLYIKQSALLDPLQASYFTKVNESLFDKKVDEMVAFLKTADGAVKDMLGHVDSPMIMDLLLKIITLDRPEGSPGIVEWLYTQDMMPILLSFLGPNNSWATQTAAGDFMKAIITVSANASQNEQTCIGPNELTRQLVSHPCIDQLIGYMLTGGNALTVGVGIVIEVIRKNNSDYDPDVGTEANSIPSSRDPIYLGTLLRMFAENVPNFMQLMGNTPAQKTQLNSTFDEKIEPLGFDRFKTCELMAELLHCSNMGLLNEYGSEAVIATRDAERKRLRSAGRLGPNGGEEAPTSGTDLLTLHAPIPPSVEEARRLEVTNVSITDEDGFEEVTHAVGLGEEERGSLPTIEVKPIPSILEKDDDDFVDEPLSSPRLNTQDEHALEMDLPRFDDPDLMVAPLSPTKRVVSDVGHEVMPLPEETGGVLATLGSDDFVTEATEPALNKDADKSDDSESSIVFTPTISSLSDSFHAARSPSPTLELREQLAKTIVSIESGIDEMPEGKEPQEKDEKAEKTEETEKTEEAEEKTESTAPDINSEEDHEHDAGNESVVLAHRAVDEPSNVSATNTLTTDPVVGDLLKMQFVEYSVVPTILSFFFSYPWNNFLHNVVYDVVQQVFNGPMDRGFNPNLAISLFESADVTTKIINGQLASEKSQAATRTRMGYMGHLTLIAEEVVKFTERHPPELLSEVVLEKVMSQDWINYVEGPLAETRERDNAILGGVRPDASMGHQAAAAGLAAVGLTGLGSSFGLNNNQNTSMALADAGLNGSLDFQSDNDGGIGPFSISAGISSGFHSSSDEDDDDNDDDINDEFRAYTDPLNSSSSLMPPALPPPPPPPPPLNIPPSRARLQLAARLAMSKRNAEAEAASQEERPDLDGDDMDMGARPLSGSLLASERMRNPFADDEDDEDDEDEDDDDDDEDDDSALNGGRGSGRVGLGWNRGSWWRSMVRGDRIGPGGVTSFGGSLGENIHDVDNIDHIDDVDHEKFGDGRDSSSDEDNADKMDVGGNEDDEEFGEFAMAEVTAKDEASAAEGTSTVVNNSMAAPGGVFFDRDRETVLFKPLAVYPPSVGSGTVDPSSSGGTSDSEVGGIAASKAANAARAELEDVLSDGTSDDGHPISQVIEAKSRTSLEEPDEDEVVV